MKSFLDFLRIREGELGRLGAVMALNLVVALGIYLGRSARDVLFYEVLGPGYLPLMFAGTAGFSIAVNLLYGRVIGRFSQERLYRLTLGAFALLALAQLGFLWARPLLPATPLFDWLVYGTVFAVTESMAIILVVATANFVHDPALFDLGGIKRLSPYYVSASHFGGLAAGLVLGHAAGLVPLPGLFGVWAGLLVAALGLALWIERRYYRRRSGGVGAASEADEGFFSTARLIALSPYLASFVGVTVLNFYLGTSYEWLLSRNATRDVGGDSVAMASWLGEVYLWGGAGAMLFQLFLMGPIVRRWGVAWANFGAPLFLTAGAIGVFGGVESTMVAVAARASFFIAENCFNQTLIRFVYNVVEERNRLRVQAFIESNVITLSVAASGLFLLAFSSFGIDILYFAFTVLVAGVAMLVLTWRMKGQYALEARRNYGVMTTHGRGQLFEDVFTARDGNSQEIVRFIQESGDGGSVAQAIRTVTRLHLGEHYPAFIHQRLDDPRREVRVAAIEGLRQVGLPQDQERLRPLLAESDPEVLIATLRAFSELSGESVSPDDFKPFLSAESPKVVSTAIALLMQNSGVAGMRVAVDRLEELRASERPEDRIILARTFGELGQKTVGDLIELLRREQGATRIAVVEALGGIPNRSVLPHLYEALRAPRLRRAAQQALRRLAPHLHRPILDSFRDPATPIEVRCHLAAVVGGVEIEGENIGRGGVDEATALLREGLNTEAVELREECARALAVRVREQRAAPVALSDLEPLVQERFREAVAHRVALDTLTEVALSSPLLAHHALLLHLLRELSERASAHLFDVLAAAFPESNFLGLYRKLNTVRGREDAIEVLENTLPLRLAQRLRVLFDAPAFKEHAATIPALPREERTAIEHLLHVREPWVLPCAWFAYRRSSTGERAGLLQLIQRHVAAAAWQSEEISMLTELNRAEILVKAELFQRVPLGDLIQVAREAEERELGPGEYAYQAGQEVDDLWVLYEGSVSLLTGGSGREERVRELRPTDTFGEAGLFQEGGLGEAVRADVRSRFLCIHRAEALELMELRPELAHQIIRVLWRRLGETYAQLRDHVDIGRQVSATVERLLGSRLQQLDAVPDIQANIQRILDTRAEVTVNLSGVELRR